MAEQSNAAFQELADTDIRVTYHSCAMERGVSVLCISVALLNCVHKRFCLRLQLATPSGHVQTVQSSTDIRRCQDEIQQEPYLEDERQHGLLPDQLCQACPAPANDWGQQNNRIDLVQCTENTSLAHTVTVVARAEPRARSTFMQIHCSQGAKYPSERPERILKSSNKPLHEAETAFSP